MPAREERISKIMEEQEVDRDVAESLFQDELEAKYPETDDLDVREAMYEADAEEDKSFVAETKAPRLDDEVNGQQADNTVGLVFTPRYEAEDLQSLIGFAVTNITDENEENEICLTLENEHHVRINLLIPADGSVFASDFYAVDLSGRRI